MKVPNLMLCCEMRQYMLLQRMPYFKLLGNVRIQTNSLRKTESESMEVRPVKLLMLQHCHSSVTMTLLEMVFYVGQLMFQILQ